MKKLKDFLHELVKQPVIKVEEKPVEQRVGVKIIVPVKGLNDKIADRMLGRRGIL